LLSCQYEQPNRLWLRHQQTVKNGGAGEIKHAFELGRGAAGGARISMQLSFAAEAILER
jgi:hypothetical protein